LANSALKFSFSLKQKLLNVKFSYRDHWM